MHTITQKQNGAVLVNGQPYGVGDLSITYTGNSVKMIAEYDRSQIVLNAQYNNIQDGNGNPFASMAALKDFIAQNFFDEATGEGGVTESEVFKAGKNLVNINAPGVGLAQNLNNAGVLVPNAAYNTTGFIKISPGDIITMSPFPRFWMFYTAPVDAAFTGALGSNAGNPNPVTVTTPLAGQYIKATFSTANWPNAQIEINSFFTSFEPYGTKRISGSIVNNPNNDLKKLNWTSDGDSISDQFEWQEDVAEKFNLICTNVGIGGTKLSGLAANAMYQNARVNAIPVTTELYTIVAGVNDWAGSVPLGAVDSVNPEEFNGAFNLLIPKLYARIPLAKKFICTPPFVKRAMPYAGWSGDGFTNAIGLTIDAYAEALRIQAKRYRLPVIDFNMLGWDKTTLLNYSPDGFHPVGIGAAALTAETISVFNGRIRP